MSTIKSIAKLLSLLVILLVTFPAFATITKIQSVPNTSCGTSVTSCSVTVSALTVGTGHFAVAVAHFQDTTTVIATASAAASGGTNGNWYHCPTTCHGTDASPTRGVDAVYIPVISVASTSVTVNFSAACTGAQIEVIEYSTDADSVILSDWRTRDQTTATTSPGGVAFTIPTNSNNLAIQYISSGGTVSAISGSYTNPADFNGLQGDAGWINTTSGSAPTWTTTSARAALGGLLFRELAVPDSRFNKMEAIPSVAQSNVSASSSITTFLPAKAGHRFIVGWRSAAAPSAVTLADDFGSSIGTLCTYTTRGNNFYFYSWIGTFAYTGTDTLVVSSTGSSSPGMSFFEVGDLSTTLDGSCVTANNDFVSFQAAVPALTTTKYRDFLLDMTDCSSTDVIGPVIGSNYTPIVSSSSTLPYMQYILTDDPGSYSTSLSDVNNRTCSEIVVAIESTTSLAVSTQAIPDAVQGQTYNFQLDATGGTGTNSWIVTGGTGTLPAGLTLSSSGNISGTCSLSGTNPVTFQVTDAGSNTATATLSITCATSASSVSRVQTLVNGTALTSVSSADIIIVQGFSTNGLFYAWIYDDQGSQCVTIPGAATGLVLGASSGVGRSYTISFWCLVSGSGADTIRLTSGISFSAKFYVVQYRDVQSVFDTKVISKTYSSSGGATITSNAITAPVAETLYSTAKVGTSGSTLGINSPFTDFGSNTGSFVVDSGDDIGAASGSQTSSFSVTGNTSNLWDILLFGLRPATTGTAPTGARRNSHVF